MYFSFQISYGFIPPVLHFQSLLVNSIICDPGNKFWSSPLDKFNHHLLTSSLLGPNIVSTIFFSNILNLCSSIMANKYFHTHTKHVKLHFRGNIRVILIFTLLVRASFSRHERRDSTGATVCNQALLLSEDAKQTCLELCDDEGLPFSVWHIKQTCGRGVVSYYYYHHTAQRLAQSFSQHLCYWLFTYSYTLQQNQ